MATPTKRTTTRRRPTPAPASDSGQPDLELDGVTDEPVDTTAETPPAPVGEDSAPKSTGRPRGRGKVRNKKSLKEQLARTWMGGATAVGFVELTTGEPVYSPVLMRHTGAMSEALDACAQDYDWLYRMLSAGGSAASVLQLSGALYALVNDLIDANSTKRRAKKETDVPVSSWEQPTGTADVPVPGDAAATAAPSGAPLARV